MLSEEISEVRDTCDSTAVSATELLFIEDDVWTVDEDGKLAKASPENEVNDKSSNDDEKENSHKKI